MRDSTPSKSRLPGILAPVLLLSLPLVLHGGPPTHGAAPGDVRRAAAGSSTALAADVFERATAQACQAEEHRRFDFWLGSWEVHAGGELAGRNEIRVVAGGCGLEESWTGAGGTRGTSLNYYDPADGRWHQLWVGSGGLILHLAGGLEDGSMVLTGERVAEGERLRDRITWSPLPDGGVRQLWEVSRDGGETWSPAFDGRYRPG